MTMPRHLIAIRHGKSEGNLANILAERGKPDIFSDEFKRRPNSQWHLTDEGILQAKAAGQWLERNFNEMIMRFYVSAYLRAIETALYLNIPNATWYTEINLREREWGALDVMSFQERQLRYADELQRRKRDGIYWAPPGGESLADVCLRVDRVLDTMHRECSQGNVLIVAHGELMRALQMRLMRLTEMDMHQILTSQEPKKKIQNCRIHHYTRIDPANKREYQNLRFFRSICPWDESLSDSDWQEIVRPKFTNEQLAEMIRSMPPRLIND
jgi:broad specificity phosphatase PhoE